MELLAFHDQDIADLPPDNQEDDLLALNIIQVLRHVDHLRD